MIAIEQIKDSYGNLIQLWGIYKIEESKNPEYLKLTYPKKHLKKRLITTYNSLKEAEKHIR